MEKPIKQLIGETLDDFIRYFSKNVSNHGIHGLEHSKNVETNGLLIASYYPDANISLIRAFAFIHDAFRHNDGFDPQHGNRAAKFIDEIKNQISGFLKEEEIEELKLACQLHTHIHSTGLISADICLDADRLDLIRCGINPTPDKMATSIGAYLAEKSFNKFLCHDIL